EGLGALWQEAANDPRFRAAQDRVTDELYYAPACEYWRQLGLKTPLGLLVLYDSILQHGDGTDPDGVQALLDRTAQRIGGHPVDGIEENAWLQAFLQTRRETLAHASDPATRQAWAEAVGRCDALRRLLEAGNFDLGGPIEVRPYGETFVIP